LAYRFFGLLCTPNCLQAARGFVSACLMFDGTRVPPWNGFCDGSDRALEQAGKPVRDPLPEVTDIERIAGTSVCPAFFGRNRPSGSVLTQADFGLGLRALAVSVFTVRSA